MDPSAAESAATAVKKEINDMLVLLKWSIMATKAISRDEIDNKDLIPPLTEIHITKLCYITRKPGSREAGHKVSMIVKDNLKLAVYWI